MVIRQATQFRASKVATIVVIKGDFKQSIDCFKGKLFNSQIKKPKSSTVFEFIPSKRTYHVDYT